MIYQHCRQVDPEVRSAIVREMEKIRRRLISSTQPRHLRRCIREAQLTMDCYAFLKRYVQSSIGLHESLAHCKLFGGYFFVHGVIDKMTVVGWGSSAALSLVSSSMPFSRCQNELLSRSRQLRLLLSQVLTCIRFFKLVKTLVPAENDGCGLRGHSRSSLRHDFRAEPVWFF